jgi:hypothetical protein
MSPLRADDLGRTSGCCRTPHYVANLGIGNYITNSRSFTLLCYEPSFFRPSQASPLSSRLSDVYIFFSPGDG